MWRFRLVLPALLVAGAIVCPAAEAVQRTFVSSKGSDANAATNCGFVNPCRGFTAALSVTDDGGEIIALDAAGYGAVTITKSVSIVANPGAYAGITAGAVDGVTIATPGVSVSLRGLVINGITQGGNGITMTNGDRLNVENCVISGFDRGINISTAAAVRVIHTVVKNNVAAGIKVENGGKIDISHSEVLNNFFNGIWLDSNVLGVRSIATISDTVSSGNVNGSGFYITANSQGEVIMSVTRSTSSHNQYGVSIFVGADGSLGTVTIGASMVSSNFYGLYQNSGVLESLGNNGVRGNLGGNTSGTITAVPNI